uniref:ADAMTS-like 5 n=1 Tax=Xenopus tropicalis TaxID=8364 RepID=A0A803J5Z0_XENTR
MLWTCRLICHCLATACVLWIFKIVPSSSQVQRNPFQWGFVNRFGPEHSPPLSSRNEWSVWHSWSPCSRTCGGGAAVRTRTCLIRDQGSPMCPGEMRQYQVCNTQDCPSGVADFRHFQCSAYNKKPLMGNYFRWVPFYSGQSDCELSCLAEGQNFYYNFGRVLDGTSCHSDYDGLCINGQCLKIGCDLILGSEEKTDICGVCGGKNISCRHYHNVYTTKYPPSALRNRNYHYVINGNWAISYPGVYNVAGTKVHYKRAADNQETFESQGPTSEDLHIMVLFTEQNLGIEYEYWLPKDYYIQHQRDRSSLQEYGEVSVPPTHPSTTQPTPKTTAQILTHHIKKQPQARLQRENTEWNQVKESIENSKCGKCKKVKGRQNKVKQYCQKDFVFRGRVLSKKTVGKETCYDIQVVMTYKNNFPILRREYIWVPNTCDCPYMSEKREYIIMARRHVNYEHTLNRILLETHSFVRPYSPKEDKMLRDLDKECAKYGIQSTKQNH